MKAVAVRPGRKNSVHLTDLPMPRLDEVPNGRGVLVKVLRIGVDATDREINEALYGNALPVTTFWCWGTSRLAGSRRSGRRSRM